MGEVFASVHQASKQASTEMETRYQYEGLSGKPSSQVGEVADGESEC